MAGATTTTLTELIRPVVDPAYSIVKWANRTPLPMLQSLGAEMISQPADTAYRYKILRSTGNSSVETYVEGQGVPTAGYQSWVSAYNNWTWYRVICQITGHAKSALGSSYVAGDAFATEIEQAIADLDDKISNTILGTTSAVGIQDAIDSTGSWAGLNKATYTDLASYEANVNGSLSVAALTLLFETLINVDISGRPDALLAPPNQLTNYLALQGPEAGNSAVAASRFVSDGGGMKVDYGYAPSGLTWFGRPIIPCLDLTSTVILGLCNVAEDWKYCTHVNLTQEPLAKLDDSDRVMVKHAGALVCKQTRRQGKLYGVTA